MHLASDYIFTLTRTPGDAPPSAGYASTSPTICVTLTWLSARSYLTILVALSPTRQR